MSSLYKTYELEIAFRNGVAGSMPLEPHLIDAHIDNYSHDVSNALKAGKKKEGVVSEEAIAAYKRGATSVFRIDDDGQPYLRDFQVTAMMLAASRIMGQWGSKGGLLQQTIQDGGVVLDERISLAGEFTLTERPIAPRSGRGGRQASIAVFEVVHGGRASFSMSIIDNKALEESLLKDIWNVAQNTGLGGFRHLGYGKFDIVKLEPVKQN